MGQQEKSLCKSRGYRQKQSQRRVRAKERDPSSWPAVFVRAIEIHSQIRGLCGNTVVAWRAQRPASTKTGMFPHASGDSLRLAVAHRCVPTARGTLYACWRLGAIAPAGKLVSCATTSWAARVTSSAGLFAAALGVAAPGSELPAWTAGWPQKSSGNLPYARACASASWLKTQLCIVRELGLALQVGARTAGRSHL